MKPRVLLFFFIFILCGCDDSSQLSNSQSLTNGEDSIVMTVGILPTTGCLPILYARETGIFDSLGLSIDVKMFGAGIDCDTAFQKGYIDMAYSDLCRSFLCFYNGIPLQVVSTVNDEWQLISNKKLRLKKRSQMRERMVGMSRHSVSDFLSDTLCELAKFDADDMLRIQINDITLREKMVDEGQIEAVFLPHPYADISKAKGNKLIFSSNKLKLNMGVLVVRMSPPIKEKYIELFIQGVKNAQARIKNPSDPVLLKILTDDYGIPIEWLSVVSIPRYEDSERISFKDLSVTIDWLKKRRLITDRQRIDSICSFFY